MLAPIVAACGGGGADDLRPRPRATPAARSTSSTRSPATTRRPTLDAAARRGRARRAARSSARPPTSRPPTAACTRCATRPPRVESIPLIVASILSKKLAAGPRRAGHGRQGRLGRVPARARAQRASSRARSSSVAERRRAACEALLTDMDQVLGRTAGNAVEVRESLEALTHPRTAEPRLLEVTLALAAHAAAARRPARRRGRRPRRRRRRAGLRRRRGALRAHGRRARRARATCSTTPPPPPAAPHVLEAVPGATGPVARASTCARSASPCWSSAAAAGARTTRSTTRVGLTDVAGLGEEVGPAAARSPSSTRATRAPRPSAPRTAPAGRVHGRRRAGRRTPP